MKRIIKLIGLMCITIFSISLLCNNSNLYKFKKNALHSKLIIDDGFNNNNNIPLSSAGYNPSFIYIDGTDPMNWTWTAGNYSWCYGSGSFSDPYIIENCMINASNSPTESGIYINNSKSVYFTIRNCSVTNAGSGPEDGGIKLVNTSNCLIYNNTCLDNQMGIILRNGCVNNTISNNIAMNNTNHGITLTLGCNYNKIIGNKAYKNTLEGIELWINCQNNIMENNAIIDNGRYGMYLYLSCNLNGILNNTVSNEGNDGIFLQNNCNFNNIYNNSLIENSNGIHLGSSCVNNTIRNNNIQGSYHYYGVFLEDSSYNNILGNSISYSSTTNIEVDGASVYNTIYGNLIIESFLGVFFQGSAYNLVYNNLIANNSINADDGGIPGYNYWNSTEKGNYWDDYGGVDSDGNGIGDTPYSIYDADGYDYKPLMKFPLFFNEVPQDTTVEIGLDYYLRWNIVNVSPFPFYYNITRNGDLIKSQEFNEIYNELSIKIIPESVCNYTIYVYDGTGRNITDSVIIEITNTEPMITAYPHPLTYYYEVGSLNHEVSWVFLDISTNHSTYDIVLNNDPFSQNNSCYSGENVNVSIDGLAIGLYNCTIVIHDGYNGSTSAYSWIIVFNNAPIFLNTPEDLTVNNGVGPKKISWIFNDNSTNNATYSLTRNGNVIYTDIPCFSNVPIEISIDNLDSGTYSFIIEIKDGYGASVVDIVIVTIENDQTDPMITLLLTTSILFGTCSILSILGLVLILKKLRIYKKKLGLSQKRKIRKHSKNLK